MADGGWRMAETETETEIRKRIGSLRAVVLRAGLRLLSWLRRARLASPCTALDPRREGAQRVLLGKALRDVVLPGRGELLVEGQERHERGKAAREARCRQRRARHDEDTERRGDDRLPAPRCAHEHDAAPLRPGETRRARDIVDLPEAELGADARGLGRALGVRHPEAVVERGRHGHGLEILTVVGAAPVERQVLDVTAIILANLCVAYIMTSQNEKAEELMRKIEKEVTLILVKVTAI